jgi:anti-anti-sigma factor
MTSPLGREASNELFDISIDIEAREIGLFGEVDMATAPLLLAAAMPFCGRRRGDLTLDLDGVTFADSSLLNTIEEIAARLDGEVWLLNPSAAIKRLFLAGGATRLLHDTPGLRVRHDKRTDEG